MAHLALPTFRALIPSPSSYPHRSRRACCPLMRLAPFLHPPRRRRRKALIIALSYKGTGTATELRSAHADGAKLVELLAERGFSRDDVTLFKDGGPGGVKPTAENIRREIKAFVRGARCGDDFVFAFLGHGKQQPNSDGTELDGMDEAIVGVDGQIMLDDELYKALVKPLPSGAMLTILMDCCSSGTVIDLPYLTECTSNGSMRRDVHQLRPTIWTKLDNMFTAPRSRFGFGPRVTCISACRDGEAAWEFSGKSSYTLIDLVVPILRYNTTADMTYEALLQKLHAKFGDISLKAAMLKEHKRQHPQLSANHRKASCAIFSFCRRTTTHIAVSGTFRMHHA
ncbi:hypothetical protein AURDEDRAFT_143089 [Auricularia subglabra TFB-10046 SS5]|nr:hypothetical protein AURDEDRAFT_143089 [Auricularia subglabra TFB-10046 SS5]